MDAKRRRNSATHTQSASWLEQSETKKKKTKIKVIRKEISPRYRKKSAQEFQKSLDAIKRAKPDRTFRIESSGLQPVTFDPQLKSVSDILLLEKHQFSQMHECIHSLRRLKLRDENLNKTFAAGRPVKLKELFKKPINQASALP